MTSSNHDDPVDHETIVTRLLDDLAAGSPPPNWEHDIAYNYLVDQGCVGAEGIKSFPRLIQILVESDLDSPTRSSIVFLAAEIFPATDQSDKDRRVLLSEIQTQVATCGGRRERVNWLSAYARVAANDDVLAEALLSLLDRTCPSCGDQTNGNWLSVSEDS